MWHSTPSRNFRAYGDFHTSAVTDRYPVEKELHFLEACRASDGTAALKAAENLADDLISLESSLMDARFAVTEIPDSIPPGMGDHQRDS